MERIIILAMIGIFLGGFALGLAFILLPLHIFLHLI